MFDWLKSRRAKPAEEPVVRFADLDGRLLHVGDEVTALRYALGQSRIVSTPEGPAYESLETGERVSWLRMIDAATGLQKVRYGHGQTS
ncbi:MAG: hypothetical protein SF053_12580 [Bacteroidia bacterium]|nr:hypothetical protein [Bacteroidia bacterium]